MLKIAHIIAVELFALLLIFKTWLVWQNKSHLLLILDKPFKWGMLLLFIIGISLGIDMYANYYNFYTPLWLKLKFAFLFISMTTGIIGNLRSNKILLLISVIFNVLIIVIANIKPN